MRRIVTIVIAFTLFAPAVWSAELAGVTMADEVAVGDAALKLNGMALRKKLWVNVYVAGLYLSEKTSDAATAVGSDGSKKVVMHFLTNKATKKKMDSAWIEGFEANSPDGYTALEARVGTFIDFFGDMKVGDVIELTIEPGVGTTALLNGETKGTIEGEDFGAALLMVWLGEHPPSDDMRSGLLGG